MSPAEAAAVLGVPVDAPPEAVQHAYLRAARQVHPDVLPEASEPERASAASRFDELSQAREVLFEHRPAMATGPAGPAPMPQEPGARIGAGPYPAPDYTRGRGLGGSLVVLALLVLMLLAIVSLQDAFRAGSSGTLDQSGGPVATSTP